jgi:integrase
MIKNAAPRTDTCRESAAKAILLLLLTGARRNEITHAKWENIDVQNGSLLVPISKSGKPRIVVFNTAACDVVRALPRLEGNPYVFPSPTTGRPCPSLFFPWDRVRKRAGIPDVRLHDLRHSFASVLVNEDCPLYDIQKLLGHANPKTTQRYAHLRREKLVRTAETMGDLVTKLSKRGAASKPVDGSGSGPEDGERTL